MFFEVGSYKVHIYSGSVPINCETLLADNPVLYMTPLQKTQTIPLSNQTVKSMGKIKIKSHSH